MFARQSRRRPPAPDHEPVLLTPPVIIWLIGLTVGAHLLRIAIYSGLFPEPEAIGEIIFGLIFVPARYVHPPASWSEVGSLLFSPAGHTLIHDGWTHLLVNMGFFLAFGAAVARRMAAGWFVALYAGGAMAGAATFLAFDPYGIVPLIGASGAVAAMVGALARVALVPGPGVPPAPFPLHNRQNALALIGVFFILDFLAFLIPYLFGIEARIAWEAHLGGFTIGFMMMPLLDGRGLRRSSP